MERHVYDTDTSLHFTFPLMSKSDRFSSCSDPLLGCSCAICRISPIRGLPELSRLSTVVLKNERAVD